jgi:hypothetical protein
MDFLFPHIARLAKVGHTSALREGAFDPGPLGILSVELVRPLTLARLLQQRRE